MAATIFNAAAQGNLASLRELLDSESPLDINSKDESGSSALVLAVQGGHVDVIQELVARGADKSEAQDLEKAQTDSAIGTLLNDEAVSPYQGQYQSPPVLYSTGEMDVHGGQRLPDGTVSYMYGGAAFVQPEYPVMAQYAPAPNFHYEGTQHHANPGDSGVEGAHERKESAAGQLPPPEVARTIPCRFFPNCRYADKCVFYHPDRPAAPGSLPMSPPGASSVTSPVSPNGVPVNGEVTTSGPSQAGPNGSPMFYQAPPLGYAYAPPYGPPQHFYMNPPLMGGPLHYSYGPGPMPLHFPVPGGPDGEAFAPAGPSPQHFSGSPPPFAYGYPQGEAEQNGYHTDSPYQPADETAQQTAEAGDSNGEEGASTDSKHAGPDAESPALEEAKGTKETDGSNAPADRSTRPSPHRRQSFNSFLHHHAIPFQPTQLSHGLASLPTQTLLDSSGAPLQYSSRGKPRRAGFGGSRFNGYPSNGSRPSRKPCTFFAVGNCRFGDQCNFPHVLPGGGELPTHASVAAGANPQQEGYVPTRGAGARKPRGGATHSSSFSNITPTGSIPAIQNANLPLAPHTKRSASAANAVSGQEVASAAEEVLEGGPASSDAKVSTQSATINGASAQNDSIKDHSASGSGPSAGASGVAKKEQGEASSRANAQQTDIKVKGGNASQVNGSQKSDQSEIGNVKQGKAASTQPRQGAMNKPRSGATGQAHVAQGGARRQGGTSGQQQQRSAPIQQRVPTLNDFPALSGPVNGSGSSTGPSSTSPPTLSSAAATVPIKANFSAILSAPAPPKKEKAGPAPSAEADKKDEREESVAKKEKKEKPAKSAAGDAQNSDSSTAANKRQAPQVDADGFSIVTAKMAAKVTSAPSPSSAPMDAATQVTSPTLAPALAV